MCRLRCVDLKKDMARSTCQGHICNVVCGHPKTGQAVGRLHESPSPSPSPDGFPMWPRKSDIRCGGVDGTREREMVVSFSALKTPPSYNCCQGNRTDKPNRIMRLKTMSVTPRSDLRPGMARSWLSRQANPSSEQTMSTTVLSLFPLGSQQRGVAWSRASTCSLPLCAEVGLLTNVSRVYFHRSARFDTRGAVTQNPMLSPDGPRSKKLHSKLGERHLELKGLLAFTTDNLSNWIDLLFPESHLPHLSASDKTNKAWWSAYTPYACSSDGQCPRNKYSADGRKCFLLQ